MDERKRHFLLKALFNPSLILVFLLRKLPIGFMFPLRVRIDAVERPYYAYCLMQAAKEAQGLGIPRISAIEFGVAAGSGLIVLNQLAAQVTRETGILIDVFGFDLEVGLPSPADYRDLPFIWQKGFFKMDRAALVQRVGEKVRLVLGNVSETVPQFNHEPIAPIGFIAFDLDFYSSTRDAFKIFDGAAERFLPRVFCFFDDVIGNDDEIMCDYTGELLAIRELNETRTNQKMCPIAGLRNKRIIRAGWPDMIYVWHDFEHTRYNTYIYPATQRN